LPAKITDEVITHYGNLRRLGLTMAKAASEAGVSKSWASEYEKGNPGISGGWQRQAVKGIYQSLKKVGEVEVPPPIPFEQLTDDGKRALDDFGFHRRLFFARRDTPWQIQAGHNLLDLWMEEGKSFAVVNEPPGSGKSTLFTHDFVTWAIARERRIRILLGHSAKGTSTDYAARVRVALMRTDPHVDPITDETASAAMCQTFGRFKPEDRDLWRRDRFIVEQLGSASATEKEPTVTAESLESAFLGGRFDISIWDDLVTGTNQRHSNSRISQREWWKTQAETRCEPGGLVVLLGQRIMSDDLFRFCLDMDLPVHDLGRRTGGRTKKYHHIVYPAHHEEMCEGKHGEYDDDDNFVSPPAWPDGCLLDPVRLPWFDLASVRESDKAIYETVYQQRDGDPSNVLVQDIWLKGGVDPQTNVSHPGCRNYDRDIAQWPYETCPDGPTFTAITVDPSPTQWWSVQWWGYHSDTKKRVLLDHKRTKMQAPELLERMPNGEYIGLLPDWVSRGFTMGLPINHLIVERNAAQRFILQYEFFTSFLSRNSVSLIPHDTTSNKADEEYGVWATLPNVYKYGQVDLPYGGSWGRKASMPLEHELTRWPNTEEEDCVMSQWFFEFNLESLKFGNRPSPRRSHFPSWMRGARGAKSLAVTKR